MVEATGEEYKGEPKGEEAAEISEMYTDDKANDMFTDEYTIKFTVRNPQDSHGHIVYEVTGEDTNGSFDVKRRYNDFFELHAQLTKRWPGIIIPNIPAKSKFSSITNQGKDAVFLQERRYYLERFLRKLARFKFVINGEECQLFFRNSTGGDIGKLLGKLPALTSE